MAKQRKTTEPGFTNRNDQVVIEKTGLRGNDHLQYVYRLLCLACRHEYGANGSDIHQRLCPACQGGRSGLPWK